MSNINKKKKKFLTISKSNKKSVITNFEKSLLRILRAMEMIEPWRRLPRKTQRVLKSIVVQPFRFERDKESGVTNNVLKAFKKDIKDFMDNSFLTNKYLKNDISCNDLLTAGLSLQLNIDVYIDKKNEDYEEWMLFQYELKKLLDIDDNNPLDIIGDIMQNFCDICTSIDTAFYLFKSHMHTATRHDPVTCKVYTLYKTPAEKIFVSIDGKKRPAFRLGSSIAGNIEWASIPSSLVPNGSKDAQEYSVYVQSHTLHRMSERLTPIDRTTIQNILYNCFNPPEFSFGPDGLPFISVLSRSAKLGYLLYEIIDNIVVIKTFLFITQNGTKEGNLLNKRYTLSKYSKKYFELDKLNTFVFTDVYKDEELKKVFTECGCEALFNVWDKDDDVSFNKDYAKNLKKIFYVDKECYV
jgi:hypothetical protein